TRREADRRAALEAELLPQVDGRAAHRARATHAHADRAGVDVLGLLVQVVVDHESPPRLRCSPAPFALAFARSLASRARCFASAASAFVASRSACLAAFAASLSDGAAAGAPALAA